LYNGLAINPTGDRVVVYTTEIFTSNDKAVNFNIGRSGCGAWTALAVDASGNKVAAVGSNTRDVWTSNDGGLTWIASSGVNTIAYQAVAMSSDGLRIGAAMANGMFAWSTDGGISFNNTATVFTTPGNAGWTSLVMSQNGLNVAASSGPTSGGSIYTSTNGGVTWTARTGAGSRRWTALACSNDCTKLVAAVSNVDLFISDDFGANWTPLNFNRTWRHISSSEDGQTFLAGADKGLYLSTDRGSSWTLINGTNTTVWTRTAIASANSQFMVATTSPGYVWTSIDGGANWVRQFGGSGVTCLSYKRIACSNDGVDVYAIEDAVKPLYVSHDSATTMGTVLLGGASRQLYGVATSDNGSTVVAPVWQQYPYLSYNSASTFTAKETDATRRWLGPGMSENGSVIALVETTTYRVYISTDHGATFTHSLTPLTNPAWRMASVSGDGNYIAAMTTNGTLAVTTDFGTSWTIVHLPNRRNSNWEFIAMSYSGEKMFAVYWSNLIAYSHDYGATWGISANTTNGLWTGVVCNHDGSQVIIAATDGQMRRSSDSGVSFPEAVAAPSRRYEALAASPALQILYGAIGGGYIYRSGDGGLTWTESGNPAKYPR